MKNETTLPDEAGTVIVGAGIVGLSAAYHLSQLTDDSIAIVEKGPLPETGGSTVHAPGGLRQSNTNKTMSQLAQYSQQLYRDLDAIGSAGSLEIATNEKEWEYIKRKKDYSTSWGVEASELLTPEEVAEYHPLVDTSKIVGGYYVPTDGKIETIELLTTLRDRAIEQGATVHPHTEVTDIEVVDGQVQSVVTDKGTIETSQVLNAANIWAPLIGEMVDVDIPLTPAEHQYVVTDSIDELAGSEGDKTPGLRYQGASLYFHRHGPGYGIGNYNHTARLVDPHTIPDHEDAIEQAPVNGYKVGDDFRSQEFRMPSSREFTEADFADAWKEATGLIPALEGKDLVRSFNGMFSFTPDGMPLLGEAPNVSGFWVAAAIWITHSGGAGKVIAELMEEGATSLPTNGAEFSRLQPHTTSPSFVTARGAENYETVYDIVHPREPSRSQRNLRTSPYHEEQEELGAEFFDSAGWERPHWYDYNENLLDEYDVPDRTGWNAKYWSPIEGAEHLAVRDGVGLFDATALSPIDVRGPDALEVVQRIFTNDLDTEVGQITYTLLVNERGGILGDMPVVRLDENHFRIVASSGANGATQYDTIRSRVSSTDAVVVDNLTSEQTAVGLWGPDARDVLAPLTSQDLSDGEFPYFTATKMYVESVPVLALRLSYAGEFGWELHTPREYGNKLWNVLWDAGQEADIVPMGSGALNTMRLEKGYPRFGADIRSEYNPYEAGLGFTVDLSKDEFVGRDALAEIESEGVDRKLVTLTLSDSDQVVTSGMPIFDGDENIGYLTSADYGYSVDEFVMYGYVPNSHSDPNTNVPIRYQDEMYDATVREGPLFDPAMERLT